MAQWRIAFRAEMGSETAATALLKKLSKVEPRATSAHRSLDDGVEMNFIVEAKTISEVHEQQNSIHDSLTDAITEIEGWSKESYGIEFDAPQLLDSGAATQ